MVEGTVVSREMDEIFGIQVLWRSEYGLRCEYCCTVQWTIDEWYGSRKSTVRRECGRSLLIDVVAVPDDFVLEWRGSTEGGGFKVSFRLPCQSRFQG